MLEQVSLLQSLGASVRVRTYAYDRSQWASRTGSVTIEHRRSSTRQKPVKSPSRALDKRLDWLVQGMDGVDVAIAHNYPASSLLGMANAPRVRIWYCHEPPRTLYVEECNPYLRENVGRAPGTDAEHIYRRWHGRGLRGIYRRAQKRRDAELDRRGVALLTSIWANSEFTRDNVRRVYGANDVHVVYPIVDHAKSGAHRSGLRRDGLKILSLTRLHWLKCLDMLLDGFALYQRRHDPAAELHIVGDGPVREALGKRAERLGVSARVHVHGFLTEPEVEALSASCDVFACLPLDEPFGLVFPEAMARGLLVLGPNHGGPLEILDGGRLGETVDPLEPEAIAESLSRLRSLSDEQADRRRSEALASVRARFSREAAKERMTSLLRRYDLLSKV
jgi:glycosyltransferase involved in cell wall biosynthesis